MLVDKLSCKMEKLLWFSLLHFFYWSIRIVPLHGASRNGRSVGKLCFATIGLQAFCCHLELMPHRLHELCHIHNSNNYLKMERSLDINTIISSSTLRGSRALEAENSEPNGVSLFKQQLIRRCSQPVLRLVHRASSIFENAENRRSKPSTTHTSSPVESVQNSLSQSSGNELQSVPSHHTSGSGRKSSVRRSYSALARSQVLVQR